MTISNCLTWVMDLFPRFWSFLQSIVFAQGVSFLSLVVVITFILLLIRAFVPRA